MSKEKQVSVDEAAVIDIAADQREETKEEKELRMLEDEYHKLSIISLVLEQRYKIKQLQAALAAFDQNDRNEQPQKKTVRKETDY